MNPHHDPSPDQRAETPSASPTPQQQAPPTDDQSAPDSVGPISDAAPADEQTGHSSQGSAPEPAQRAESSADSPDASQQRQESSLSPELEREIDEAMAAMTDDAEQSPPAETSQASPAQGSPGSPSTASAPAPGSPPIRGPRVIQAGREHRTGRVVSVGPQDIFLEFGPKELGVTSREQWADDDLPTVGDNLQVVIDRFEPNEQIYLCSRPGVVQKAEWELLQVGQIVEARVTAANKGGLELEVANHPAFMPASLVDTQRIEDLSTLVGEKVQCKVERIDRRGRGKIVLNRRHVLAEQRRQQQEQLRQELQEGQIRQGVVRKIMPFGAFVDLGGVDGLAHISDLSHDRIEKVEDVVNEGDQIDVKILKIDWERERISLGLKQTQPDPLETAIQEIQPEQILDGKVTRTTRFGAFVQLRPGVEGLVHLSELSWSHVKKVDDAVKPGQNVKVKVLSVDPDQKRFSLSIKQTTEPPEDKKRQSAEEIRKETPAQRRMREKFQAQQKQEQAGGLKGGFGADLGKGLGDLSL